MADIAVTDWGKTWYWVLTAIFAISGLMFLIVSLSTRRESLPKFCFLSALACYTISMGYFAMAADLGWVGVEVEFVREDFSALAGGYPTRQVFWIRYVTWLISTPLLMAELFILVSAPIEVILAGTFLIAMTMATGLGGAVIPRSYKWAYYFYGAIACAGIAYMIALTGYRLASATSEPMRRMYILCSLVVVILWSGYGLAFGLSEGGNVISPDGEALFYGVLDLLGGPVYGGLIAFAAHHYPSEIDDGSNPIRLRLMTDRRAES